MHVGCIHGDQVTAPERDTNEVQLNIGWMVVCGNREDKESS